MNYDLIEKKIKEYKISRLSINTESNMINITIDCNKKKYVIRNIYEYDRIDTESILNAIYLTLSKNEWRNKKW